MKAQKVTEIAVSQVRAGSNDRKHFNEQALAELASSIAQHGLAQPITLRPVGDGYEIVAGERRFRAMSQVLGWQTVPAIVRKLSDEEAAAIMLVENTSRVDLDAIAEAEAYQVRAERFGWDEARIAETAGVSLARVRERMRLLGLASDVQHLVKIGQLPMGHALLLTDLDVNRQRIAVQVFAKAQHMPLSRWREIVCQLVQQQADDQQISLFDLDEMLIQQVETDTVVKLSGKQAHTGAPTAGHLPKPRTTRQAEPTGKMIERYILDLQQAGHEAEAAAIGTLYNALVAGNWVSVPAGSALAKASTSSVGSDTYEIIE